MSKVIIVLVSEEICSLIISGDNEESKEGWTTVLFSLLQPELNIASNGVKKEILKCILWLLAIPDTILFITLDIQAFTFAEGILSICLLFPGIRFINSLIKKFIKNKTNNFQVLLLWCNGYIY